MNYYRRQRKSTAISKGALIEMKSLHSPPHDVQTTFIVTMMMLADGVTINKMRYNLTDSKKFIGTNFSIGYCGVMKVK